LTLATTRSPCRHLSSSTKSRMQRWTVTSPLTSHTTARGAEVHRAQTTSMMRSTAADIDESWAPVNAALTAGEPRFSCVAALRLHRSHQHYKQIARGQQIYCQPAEILYPTVDLRSLLTKTRVDLPAMRERETQTAPGYCKFRERLFTWRRQL